MIVFSVHSDKKYQKRKFAVPADPKKNKNGVRYIDDPDQELLEYKKRGYFSKEELKLNMALPNLSKFCSSLDDRLSGLKIERTEKNRDFGTAALWPRKGNPAQVTFESFQFNSKTSSKTLMEINNLRMLGGDTNIIRLERCYYKREGEYQRVYLVYPRVSKNALQLLEEFKEDDSPDESRILNILKNFAQGLKAVHDKSLINGSISLESLLIDYNEVGYLSNFQNSNYVNEKCVGVKSRNRIYTAPEIYKDICGKSADIFALGIVFAAFLSQDKPENFLAGSEYGKKVSLPLVNEFTKYRPLIEGMCAWESRDRLKIEQVISFLDRVDKKLIEEPSAEVSVRRDQNSTAKKQKKVDQKNKGKKKHKASIRRIII
jgi:serine/threonine protein kinase